MCDKVEANYNIIAHLESGTKYRLMAKSTASLGIATDSQVLSNNIKMPSVSISISC